jgi:hypothetical protein
MMTAMPKRSHLCKLPSPPTHRTMKVVKVGITLQMSMNQFALAIWYPCNFSNNLNVWKLCSTIVEKSEEAEASNSWNYAWQNEQITRMIEDAHHCCRGEQKATWSSVSYQVCLRGRCSSQPWSTIFDALETIQGQRPRTVYCTRFVDRLNVCMGIPSWHSTLLWATLMDLLFIHTTMCSEGCALTMLTHQQKKLVRM